MKLSTTTLSISLFCILLALTGQTHAADDAVGLIVSSYGQVYISSGQRNPWQKAESGARLYPGSSVRTGPYSGASLRMEDESLLRLSQDTEFQVEQVRISSFWRAATALVKRLNTSYRLLKGKLWGRNNNRDTQANVMTTTATIGIRGTEYVVEVDAAVSRVSILEGAVEARNELGELIIHGGEQAVIERDTAPARLTTISPAESVQWTVMLPELLDVPHHLKRAFTDKSAAADFYDAYQAGDYARGMELLSGVSGDNLDLLLLKHWIEFKAGDPVTGYQDLRRTAAAHPDNNPLQELMALAAFVSGEIQTGQGVLDQLHQQQRVSDSG